MNEQAIHSLNNLLTGNSYPGRGIVMGLSEDKQHAVLAYFIMGRSQNSRNRVFVKTEDGFKTQAFDPAKLEDPSLIIYHPMRVVGRDVVLTNGDQTEVVCAHLREGKGLTEAIMTQSFEPDAPNLTPRISGLLRENGSYLLSIAKSVDAEGSAPQHQFFHYPGTPGLGHFISTYQHDGSPLPSFFGEPKRVELTNGIDALCEMIWESLDEDNKVSLYVAYRNLETGAMEERMRNKLEEA